MGSAINDDLLSVEGNPAVERALRKFNASGNEDIEALLDVIAGQMKEKLLVVAPVIFHDDDKMSEERSVEFQMISIEEENFMVAFTSTAEFEKGEKTSGIPVAFEELAEIAYSSEECTGLVINPWGESAFVSRAGLNYMLDIAAPKTQDQIDLENGETAYDEGDYETAAELFQKSADEGNARAMGSLGDCYFYGRGVSQDKKKAFDCWMRGALFNDIGATYKLGDMYFYGDGTETDTSLAKMLYRKAFFMAINDMEFDMYVFPDAALRMIRHCSEELQIADLKALVDDCVEGLEMRIEGGDRFSDELLAEAKEFKSMFK